MEQTIFHKTISMLQATEFKLLLKIENRKKNRNILENILFKILNFFKKLIFMKTKVLEVGFYFLSSDIRSIGIFLFIVCAFLYYIFGINSNIISNIFPFIFCISIYFTLFKVPSSFCASNVKNKDIKEIIKIFNDYNLVKNEYKIVKNIFVELKENTKNVILTLRGIIAFIWTSFFYIIDNFVIQEIKDNMNVTQDITKIIIYFIIIFGVHIMIESYNKGIGYIMKSFEFALIEYESNLDLDTQNLIK